VCNGPLLTTFSGGRGKGAAVIQMRIAVYEAFSQPTCSPTSPDISQAPQEVVFTTGIASAQILDANNMAGSTIAPGGKCGPSACTASATGAAFDCSSLPGDPMTPLSGVALAGVAITLDDPFIGDYVTVFTRDPAGALNTPGPTFPAGATATPTPSMQGLATATPSPTATPKPSASATSTPSPQPTSTSSATLSPTLTAAPTSTPTLVPPSATPTPSAVPSAVFTATPSSTSNPVASPTPTQEFSICDVNQDQQVNGADLAALIEALFTPDAMHADVNIDGATTVADVVSLNKRIASGGCSG
jgi:hypothetical protein